MKNLYYIIIILLLYINNIKCDDSSSDSIDVKDDPFLNGTITYYKVFGLGNDASEKDIKRAYRKLAVKYHPDKISDSNQKKFYEKIFIRIVMAFETLTDEKSRKEYDEMVKVGVYEYDKHAFMKATRGYSDEDLYREARERYRRYEEAERRALWLSMISTLLVVILPIAYVIHDMNKKKKSRAQQTKESVADKYKERQKEKQKRLQLKKSQEELLAKAKAESNEKFNEIMSQNLQSKEIVAGAFIQSKKQSSNNDKKSKKNKKIRKSSWNNEELSILAKALAKYPGGTKDRWDRITEMVNSVYGDEYHIRHSKDVIKKAREVRIQAIASNTNDNANTNNDTTINSNTDSGNDNNNSKKEYVDNEVNDSDNNEWTLEQQKQLENALKLYPSNGNYTANERWKLIAQSVNGKTKKQCINRFKEIRQEILAAKKNH